MSAMGRWPKRWNHPNSMMPIRLPAWKLGAVGSNPQYMVIGRSSALRSAASSDTWYTKPRSRKVSNRFWGTANYEARSGDQLRLYNLAQLSHMMRRLDSWLTPGSARKRSPASGKAQSKCGKSDETTSVSSPIEATTPARLHSSTSTEQKHWRFQYSSGGMV